MNRIWDQPLRRQLFIAILLLLVPVLVAAIWSGRVSLREREGDLGVQSQVLAAAIAAAVDRDLASVDALVADLSVQPFTQTLDADAARELFARVSIGRRSIGGIVLLRSDGVEVVRQETFPVSPRALDWARETLRTGRRAVSPLQVKYATAPNHVVIAYPVMDRASSVIAAIVVAIQIDRLQEVFATLPLPAGSVAEISDAGGSILARSVDPERSVGQKLADGPRASLVPGTPAARDDADGVRRMFGEARAETGPWLVSVGVPVSLAVQRASSLWLRSFTILGLGLAGWLVVAVVASRRLGESLGHLDAEAQRIAGGDFRPLDRKPMASREFVELQDAVDQMLVRFNETRAALDEQMAEERGMRQELQSLQRQVIRQERLAAVGQLVSGVAHEINNPLQAILGFAELLQIQGNIPDSVKGDLHLIQKESARACAIIRNLAMFARQQTADAAPVRLTDAITSVVELRHRRLESENIDLRIEDGAVNLVLAVVTELQQVVLNFVVNAEQAILLSGRLPGRITIRTKDVGDRVVLEVEDTGPGVPPDHEAKLFQPFFTTKPVGQGTGLGLSISYGIIDSYGGHTGYRSAPAGGAVFYFDLPAIAD